MLQRKPVSGTVAIVTNMFNTDNVVAERCRPFVFSTPASILPSANNHRVLLCVSFFYSSFFFFFLLACFPLFSLSFFLFCCLFVCFFFAKLSLQIGHAEHLRATNGDKQTGK